MVLATRLTSMEIKLLDVFKLPILYCFFKKYFLPIYSNIHLCSFAFVFYHFSTRLAIVCNNSQRLKTTAVLPNGITSPQATLSAQPLSIADIQLVSIGHSIVLFSCSIV